MAEVKAVVVKTYTQRLNDWATQQRVPIEFLYSNTFDQENKTKKDPLWMCIIRVVNKEDNLVGQRGETKSMAQERAAAQFFEAKADEGILEMISKNKFKPLVANSLNEFRHKFSVRPFSIDIQPMEESDFGPARLSMVLAATQKKGDPRTPAVRARLAKKQVAQTLKQSNRWFKCVIGHPLWGHHKTVSGAGPSASQAQRNAEVRVLEMCMEDTEMFGGLVMPDSKGLTPAAELIESGEILTLSDIEDEYTAGRVHGHLAKSVALGIDCEAVPVDAERKNLKVALIQITGDAMTLLYQVDLPDATPVQKKLGQDLRVMLLQPRLVFMVDSRQDCLWLKQAGFYIKNFVDLQEVASKYPEFGDKPGLAVMAARMCRLQVDKQDWIRRSTWDSLKLTPTQIKYAALDSIVTLVVGLAFQQRSKAAPSDKMYLKHKQHRQEEEQQQQQEVKEKDKKE